MIAFFLMFGLSACSTSNTTYPGTCLVDVSLAIPQARVGDVVVIDGGPFTVDYDTQVLVDGVAATGISVSRIDCDPCDTCVDDQDCDGCRECTACDEDCAPCLETTSFIVPDVEPGVQAVVLINAYGASEGLVLDVLPAADDTDTDVVDTDTDVIDSDTDVADTDTDVIDTDTDSADTDTDSVDTDTDVVDTDTDVIDSDTDVIDSDTDTGASDTDGETPAKFWDGSWSRWVLGFIL